LDNININIENNRYSVIEFDVINIGTYSSNSNIGTYSSNNSNTIINSTIDYKSYPILNLSNINYEYKVGATNSVDITYLPVSKNINHLATPDSKKVEYFFNKKNLMMDIKGYGDIDVNSEFKIVLDNIKMYEIDMVPFFKYFQQKNIYRGIQTPLVGESPFMGFTQNKYPFIENSSIPFESIDIRLKP
jgi:hypothetical protein